MKKLMIFITGLILFSSLSLGAVYAQESQVTVEVNPNLELFSVVYILAFNGSDPFIIAPQEYVQEVLTYFAPYKEHEAIKYIRKVLDSSYPYFYRDDAIRELSSRLAMLNYLPNEANLGDLKPLAEFANESKFMEFYKAHEEEYHREVSLLENYLKCVPEEYKKLFHTYGERHTEEVLMFGLDLTCDLFIVGMIIHSDTLLIQN